MTGECMGSMSPFPHLTLWNYETSLSIALPSLGTSLLFFPHLTPLCHFKSFHLSSVHLFFSLSLSLSHLTLLTPFSSIFSLISTSLVSPHTCFASSSIPLFTHTSSFPLPLFRSLCQLLSLFLSLLPLPSLSKWWRCVFIRSDSVKSSIKVTVAFSMTQPYYLSHSVSLSFTHIHTCFLPGYFAASWDT